MFALVEPFMMGQLVDYPHLGCAMLIAACQEKGIRTKLVKGQTWHLQNMFVADSEELWCLIRDLKEEDLKKIGISKKRQELKLSEFQSILKGLYEKIIIDKDIRQYFNAQCNQEFQDWYVILGEIYSYYLNELRVDHLQIVERYVGEILQGRPRCVGFSILSKFDPFTRAIRKRIKEISQIPIIIGGALTPFLDLRNVKELFTKEAFDYLVIGPAEYSLPVLIEAIDNNQEPVGIPNVFYKKNGHIKGNELRAIDDLDTLPYPDFSQFDLALYPTPKRILPLQTSRGCYWDKCAFCSHQDYAFGTYRTWSIEKVIDVLKYLQYQYATNHFFICDAELPAARAKRISQALLNEHLSVNIYSWARLEEEYNHDELFALMHQAGFTVIHWGLESGSQRVLDLMQKGTNIATASDILKKSTRNGISNFLFIMFGFPGESLQEAQETVNFLEKHHEYIETYEIAPFEINATSPIGRNPSKWGVVLQKDGHYMTGSGMSREETAEFLRRFQKQIEVNAIKIKSDRLKYSLPGWPSEMYHFFALCHGLMSSANISRAFERKEFQGIFPLVGGELITEDGQVFFQPINFQETSWINQIRPPKRKAVGPLEEKLILLSNGKLSISEIIHFLEQGENGIGERETLEGDVLSFFWKVFTGHYGLAFSKSWLQNRGD